MDLALISVNMWLLPPPFSVENKKRIDSLNDLCQKHKLDFICLQEVWLNSYVDYIRNKFSNYYFIGKKDVLFNKTGLLILSRHKPIKFEKHSLKFIWNSALYDSIARKGWLLAQFQISDQKIDLLNVHLNCPTNKKQSKVWGNQFKEISEIISEKQENLIVIGDFNGECGNLLKDSASIRNLSNGVKSFTLSNPYNHKGFHRITTRFFNYEEDVDHVMVFPKNHGCLITKKLITNPLVSDHYPVYAEIKI